ncbi:beta-ketoadipate enol-lactone hydrolase [Coprinopsis cinerea okayama7|uniref:Beta-ketoadipate enol-lactone hydrolase n=1 Tax=Coprinopsis cinerea (strain Okayama-7 / 130 / ATCC MYA-4618 / FGSC 9003) TaxID=240176 RepID=A8PET2_COPC7|nr:beta-ketoadipate enol-lactone hydrolase [Coprinopsis cinerea okayama7\|eukprot:XP_001840839.1 beta-ketoadipate enol-lactone hydrolase [Coprinopsis cinerea okayama7\
MSKSKLLPGRYPAPGTDPVADAIRKRRGERGLTALDGNLLHFAEGARGYNDLLGALRTGGKVPGDLRELMILRIAALNHAAYEWVQHEPIGRKEGLSTGQLYSIRDIDTPLPPAKGLFTPLQEAALDFVDKLTLVSSSSFTVDHGVKYKDALRKYVEGTGHSEVEELTNALYSESSMLVATYNLVSRFLVATDVDGRAEQQVPWPVERVEHNVTLPSFPKSEATHQIYAVTLRHPEQDAPWIVLSNSLLTSTRMWGWIVPYLLDGGFHASGGNSKRRYNILLHDQRGHGRSTLPPNPADSVRYHDDDSARRSTIPLLAWDVQNLLVSDEIKEVIDGDSKGLKPIHAVIGVSQGGACAMAFGASYPTSSGSPDTTARKTKAIIACDTSARTPAGNRDAWKERVGLVFGGAGLDDAQSVGLSRLADVTLPRWFPAASPLPPSRAALVRKMVEETPVEGFVEGARALGSYDLLEGSTGEKLDMPGRPPLLEGRDLKVLLVAGSLDGNGKVGEGLKGLAEKWDRADYKAVEGSGHLPMVDRPEVWCEVVGDWLGGL